MYPKYPPRTAPLQLYFKAIHKILELLNSSKPSAQPKTNPPKTDPNAVTIPTRIPIIGITEPEKLAVGKCPCCQRKIDLWLSPEGIEVSSHKQESKNDTLF